MSEQTAQPLTITIPTDLLAIVGEVSHYLLTSYCAPFAIRDTQDAAMAECEAAERAQYPAFAPIEFRWMPQGEALRLHVRGSGSWDDTAYTVTRITVLAAGSAPTRPPMVAPPTPERAVTPEIAAAVLHHFGEAGGVEGDEQTSDLIAVVASGGAAAIKSLLAEIEQATPGWFTPTADEVQGLQEIASRLRTP